MADWTVVIESRHHYAEGEPSVPRVVEYDGPEDRKQEAIASAMEQWHDDQQQCVSR